MPSTHELPLRKICFCFLLLAAGLLALPVSAQVTTGTPPLDSFSGGPDIVNLGDLNVHLGIQVLNKPGRGGPFFYNVSYDSAIWTPVPSGTAAVWTPSATWGWTEQSAASSGYVTYSYNAFFCYTLENGRRQITGSEDLWYNFIYYDPSGTSHSFGPNVEAYVESGTCGSSSQTSFTATAPDASGYVLQFSTSGTATVTNSVGASANPPINTQTGAVTITDRNGNETSVSSSSVFTDTLGGTVLTVTGSGTPSSPNTYTYTAPSGANAPYTMKFTTYSVETNFGCSEIGDYGVGGTTTANLVSEIDLPDGSKYTFTYEPTPSHSGFVTGRLASVTLPTGGTISYAYSGGNNGINCADGSTATLTRTTPDGSWTYAQAKGTGAASTTMVTDPASNQTFMQFQSGLETERQVYQGSQASGTLLRQLVTCYNGNTSSCNSTAVTPPITQRTVFDQYGSNGPQCEHNTLYNSAGGLTEQDDYDYGSGAPGALLRKIQITYAPLGNITTFPQTVALQNGSGTTLAQTTYNYDGTTPTTTSGIAQHTSVSGSRGNLTSINYPVSGLNAYFTYYDTGSLNTSVDVNGATTTHNYSNNTADCQMAFPTSISEPLSLSRSMAWNCTGGVQLTSTDENGQSVTTAYTDPYFWRPFSGTDQQNNTTIFGYGFNPTYTTRSLIFNSNQSDASTGRGFDGLGRLIETSHVQTPGGSVWDQIVLSYDTNGRPFKTSVPCVTTGSWTCPTWGQTTTYDALNRVSQVTDAGGGITTYTYSNNDILITRGPAPTGENTKRRQLEYDSLGRLTSVCEVTSASGAGTCGQSNPLTGYWTKYSYDALGNLLTVTQNAQAASGSQQTRTFAYDAMSRLTSETNPESATTSYTYDTNSTCGTSNADLVKRVDAVGNTTCYTYDALHRTLSTTYSTTGSTISTPSKFFVYDGATVNGAVMQNAKARLAEAYTGSSASKLTDEGFSYTARGEISDLYASTPNSGTYYHSAATFWPNGVMSQLSGYSGSNLNYLAPYNVDGEGRVYSNGWLNSTTYNAASQPTQLSFSSGDNDVFSYDPNTDRMTQYKYNVGAQSVVGNLAWNANGTLGSLAITDPFETSDNQTCNYAHDDLVRIAGANCGSQTWSQTFGYDPFGNITANGTLSFQPIYSAATNQMTGIGSNTPTYDADGNVTDDFIDTYTWYADGHAASIDGQAITYDALGRMVEVNANGTFSQRMYSPTGFLMEFPAQQKKIVPLPGGDAVVYLPSAPGGYYYRHADWLGNSRLGSTPSQTMYYDLAYAPFGTPYAQDNPTEYVFTGIEHAFPDLYDFPAREFNIQGRWGSPDPAGLAAVDLTNPQSWNRYAYVVNNPLAFLDPLGLDLTTNCDGGPCYGYDSITVMSNVGNPFGGAGSNNINAEAQIFARGVDDEWIRALGRGVVAGAGGIGDWRFIAGFYALSAAGGYALVEGGIGGLGEEAARGMAQSGYGIISSTTNAAGGTVVTSEGTVVGSDFASVVNSSLYNGEVNILTGVDGLADGTMLSNPTFYAEDVAAYGDIPGINIFNISSMTPAQIGAVVNGTGTIIGAFCNSGACLLPFLVP